MRLSWLELIDFRSYEQLGWTPDRRVNVLVGRNAAGKTNLLESIGYLASLRSFRKVADSVLVRTGASRAVIRGEVVGERATTLVEVEVPVAGRRRAQVNRGRLGRLSELLGKVRAVTFLPDDLDVVKRGPAYRRDLLDSIAVQVWPGAQRDQQEYDRTLRQRNRLLKQMGRGADPISLEVWDDRLSRAGGAVMARRMAVIREVTPPAGAVYRYLAGGPAVVRIEYRSAWGADAARDAAGWRAALRAALEKARRSDLERRVSTVGPHRDDVILLLDGRDARVKASQGEQRTLTLSLRLAAHRAVEASIGEAPLLLLDDVFSELDPERSAALVGALPDAQTFITAARRHDVPIEGRRWLLEEGALR